MNGAGAGSRAKGGKHVMAPNYIIFSNTSSPETSPIKIRPRCDVIRLEKIIQCNCATRYVYIYFFPFRIQKESECKFIRELLVGESTPLMPSGRSLSFLCCANKSCVMSSCKNTINCAPEKNSLVYIVRKKFQICVR